MRASAFVLLLALSGCQGGRMSLAAPHLAREEELAPAAAESRWGVLLDRAAGYENQNLKSRDVYWYRTWRAAAMIGLGQSKEARQVLEGVQSEVASASPAPAQPERLRIFILDQLARCALAEHQPAAALPHLERALAMSGEVGPELTGPCIRDLMSVVRLAQIQEVAALAGDAGRVESARSQAQRLLQRWSTCLASNDYVAMSPSASLATIMSGAALPAAIASAPPPAPPASPYGPPPVATPPPPAPPPMAAPPPGLPPPPPAPVGIAPSNRGIAGLPTVSARYALVNPEPYKEGMEAIAPLLKGAGKEASLEVVIRSDGEHHALRMNVRGRYREVEELVPLLKASVVFFERTRAVKPRVERVIIKGEGFEVLARREDVMELFLERIDAPVLAGRLQRLM